MLQPTVQSLQAQVDLLAEVVRCVIAELSVDAAARVCGGIDRALSAHPPASETADVAMTGLLSALVGRRPTKN